MKFKVIMTLVLMALLTGCWEQSDTIRIGANGITSFDTKVVVFDDGFSIDDIEGLASEQIGYLNQAGWSAKKEWISKEMPFELRFYGEGDLSKIGDKTDFYNLTRLDGNKIEIQFIPAEFKGGKSTRSMKFDVASSEGVSIVDEQGNKVEEIKDVDAKHKYIIEF